MKLRDIFLSKGLASSGTESGMFFVVGGTETSGSTIGKILGKGIWQHL
jgi:hypothetical protein